VGEGAWIAPGASVIGDVTLGVDVSIWYAAVLRGDVEAISVGDRSNVQDGAILHVTQGRYACVVGAEVTIGHRAVVHGCRVGDGALIGIGAIVLDGATVGDEALVAAGAVVTPESEVAPRTLVVGTPARPVRELRSDELAIQRKRTLEYVQTARGHRT
jgi:carbonic anhydrase/acetyltransferase-like protein (isoleucine patch superfamily)